MIRITARLSPGRRSATYGSSLTAGQKSRRHIAVRPSISLGGRSRWLSDDPDVLANAASSLAYFGEDIGAMIGLVDRALALNPSFARGWYLSGVLGYWPVQPDLAIEHVETRMRLSPRERMGMIRLPVIGIGPFLQTAVRRGGIQASSCDPRTSRFPGAIPPSRRLLRPYGAARRSAAIVDIGCAPLPPCRCRAISLSATPSIASFYLRACGSRRARQHEPDPPSRRDPRR